MTPPRPSSPADPATPVRVVVTDDHPIVLSGVRQLFHTVPDVELVGVADSGTQTIAVCAATTPHLLLLDLRLPDLSASTVCRRVRAASPQTAVAVWSAHPEPMALRRCLEAGATACLVKDIGEYDLRELVIRVARGRTVIDPRLVATLIPVADGDALSRRETEVLHLMARGQSTDTIARRLGISINTVKSHRHALLAKLGARNRVEALVIADRQGLLRPQRGASDRNDLPL